MCICGMLCQAQDDPAARFSLLNLSDNSITKKLAKNTTRLDMPADAIRLAIADLGTIDEFTRPFIRYVWVPEPNIKNSAAISFAVNSVISKVPLIVNPDILFEGRLLRIDLRKYVPNDIELAKIIQVYDKLGTDPYFHLIESSYVVPSNAKVITNSADPAGSTRFLYNDGHYFLNNQNQLFILSGKTWAPYAGTEFKNAASVFGSHVGLEQSTILLGMSKSTAIITRYDYFLSRILTTLDGGLYYELAGIERNPKGKSAQEALLESLGSSESRVAVLKSDQRAALFKSRVTGRPRRIDIFQGEGVAVSNGSGLITLTHDSKEGDIKAIQDPIRNLLEFEDAARELIAEKSNGLHIFALFNSKGELQDSAPDNVVKDHTIPAPHTARLQCAISCIRCHGPLEGYQPFDNEVQKMLSGLFDIYDDVSSKANVPETLTRLAGLYSGDLSKVLRRGRDDYSDAAIRATYGNYNVAQISEIISEIYENYNYREVDAAIASRELGINVPEDQAIEYFVEIVKPRLVMANGVVPEDPIIAALKTGLRVNRFQWELVYADAAIRSMDFIGEIK